jgi:dimethylargininase
MPPTFHFDQALMRDPADSVVNGLRAVDRGAPDLDALRREVRTYREALERAGVSVEVLPALQGFPDAIFVEDPALVFSEGAVVLRPGAPTRRGEAAELATALRRRFNWVLELGEGFVDGGDVLTTPTGVLIGLSARTDETGARSLQALLTRLGRRSTIVKTPEGVLHLKSDCSLIDDETILATERLAASGIFPDYRIVVTPEGEEAAANSLRVNEKVFVGDAFPNTAERLASLGYSVERLPQSQIALLDAGFSCLSLRWRAPRGGSRG